MRLWHGLRGDIWRVKMCRRRERTTVTHTFCVAHSVVDQEITVSVCVRVCLSYRLSVSLSICVPFLSVTG